MKCFVGLIALLLTYELAYAQSASPKVLLPQVDSMVVEMDKLFINPKNVKELYVLKDPTPELLMHNRGANLIMTFKKVPRLAALNSLKADSIAMNAPRSLYVIDGALVTDTTGVKLDALNIKKLEILLGGTAKGIVVCQPPAPVYLITTHAKGKKIKQPK